MYAFQDNLRPQNLTNYIEWRESIRHWTSLFCVKPVTTVKTNTSGKKTCFSSNFDLKKSLLVYEIGIPPLNTSQKFSYQRKKVIFDMFRENNLPPTYLCSELKE